MAVPKSGCNKIKTIGKNAKIKVFINLDGLLISSLYFSKYAAKAKIIPIFVISDGWI